MGNACGIPSEDEVSERERPVRQQNYSSRYQSRKEVEFPDFEEYGNGKTIGHGVQQIPSYKCPIPYDELNKKREEFWKSRVNHRAVWKVIRECCTTDSDTAVILLEAAEMACLNGSLREVFLLSNPEIIFRVPNYCVCDPSFERDYDKIEKEMKDVPEQKIKVVCYYLAKNKNINIETTNKASVADVKKAFAKKAKVDMKKNSIRFLFKGQELTDDHQLCLNRVENMSKIQVMVREKD